MARTSIYLNFPGTTEAAFQFYKGVFGGDFHDPGIQLFGQLGDAIPESERTFVLHVELPITGGLVLMGTDVPESRGLSVICGNNVHINLEPDSLEETQRLFEQLSVGGVVTAPFEKAFWGAWFGSCTDAFGICWSVNFALPD